MWQLVSFIAGKRSGLHCRADRNFAVIDVSSDRPGSLLQQGSQVVADFKGLIQRGFLSRLQNLFRSE